MMFKIGNHFVNLEHFRGAILSEDNFGSRCYQFLPVSKDFETLIIPYTDEVKEDLEWAIQPMVIEEIDIEDLFNNDKGEKQ